MMGSLLIWIWIWSMLEAEDNKIEDNAWVVLVIAVVIILVALISFNLSDLT